MSTMLHTTPDGITHEFPSDLDECAALREHLTGQAMEVQSKLGVSRDFHDDGRMMSRPEFERRRQWLKREMLAIRERLLALKSHVARVRQEAHERESARPEPRRKRSREAGQLLNEAMIHLRRATWDDEDQEDNALDFMQRVDEFCLSGLVEDESGAS